MTDVANRWRRNRSAAAIETAVPERLWPGLGTSLLLGIVLFGGCSRSVAPAARSDNSPFKTARYAHMVPIPTGVVHRETLVGPSHDLGGSPQMDAVVWVFRHDQPVTDLKAYYSRAFPSAEISEFELDGAATELTIHPAGARPKEEVVVTIRAGELQVRETLAPVPLDQLASELSNSDDTIRR
jgi:hypothetical protein